jgi:Uma2 family endonuclease
MGGEAMSLQSKPRVTSEEYLAGERATEERHEYFQGEVFAKGGASFEHVQIASHLIGCLHEPLREKPCFVFLSNLRVKIRKTGAYAYPDVGVLCEQPKFDDLDQDTILNPRLLIEIFSPATEAFDRGKKFAHYRTIESLSEYLLVAQDQPRIEQYIRQSSGDWLLHEATDLSDTIRLPSIECELKLAEVYERVEFPDSE